MRLIIFLLLFLTIFSNEYAISFFFKKNIADTTKIQLRFLNIFLIFVLFITPIYYLKFKNLKLKYKTYIIFLMIFFFDFLSGYFHYGYPNKSPYFYIYPYDWLRGKPNVLDHNSYGFRGKKPDFERKKEDYVIGFFGGSTGYNGDPPIINILENHIKELGVSTLVINFSSITSNHNQHLHRLMEFSQFKFDLIIFYGGGNEIIAPYYYDSRPGYPYNFYLHDSDTNLFLNVLIKYSNLIAEYDKRFKIYNYRIFNPRNSSDELFINWFEDIKINYFGTIKKADLLTSKIIKPNKCKKSKFIAVLQPLNFGDINNNIRLEFMVNNTRKLIKNYEIYDLYDLKDLLKFTDFIHVSQSSNEIIANQIFKILKDNNLICNKKI